MHLSGRLIELRPLTLEERFLFFRWATRSEATPFWYGELYGDEVPSYVVFKLDWPEHYFTGFKPHLGRCFGIIEAGELIGQINYNEINFKDHSVELDIIIAKQGHTGQGYGTEAIQLLTQYLFSEMSIRRCGIEVVAKNPRAARAYEKAGYHLSYSYVREGIEWFVMACLAANEVRVLS